MREVSNEKDLRVTKTDSAIISIFFYFMSKMQIQKISVTDICKRAKISRKTFYNHYVDIYDLVEKIGKLIAERFLKMILQKNTEDFNLYDIVREFLNEHNGTYKILPENHELITEIAVKHIKENISHNGDEEIFTKIDFIFFGTNGIYKTWYKNSRQDNSLQIIGNQLGKIIRNIL